MAIDTRWVLDPWNKSYPSGRVFSFLPPAKTSSRGFLRYPLVTRGILPITERSLGVTLILQIFNQLFPCFRTLLLLNTLLALDISSLEQASRAFDLIVVGLSYLLGSGAFWCWIASFSPKTYVVVCLLRPPSGF